MTRDDLTALLRGKPALAKANPNWREKVHDLLVNTGLDGQPLRVIPPPVDSIGGILQSKTPGRATKAPVKPGKPSGSPLERKFDLCWQAIGGVEPERELRFCEKRWRFDFCWPLVFLAIEIQGGVWRAKGAHNTGLAMQRDCEKGLEAILLGWTVITLTPNMINTATLLRIKNHFNL